MKTNNINVMQVMDKLAIRGSPIHGVSRLLLNWWPKLESTNINMSLCVFRGFEGGGDTFRAHGIEFTDLNRSKYDFRTIKDLIDLIRINQVDILHCHGYGATTFGRIAGILTGTPVIIQEHMIDEKIPFPQKISDALLSPFTTKGIAVSNAVGRFMEECRYISPKIMTTIYNGIPTDYVREYSLDEKQEIAIKYGLDNTKQIVGIVGRLDPIKAHVDFIHAASRVVKKYPDTHFVIVGEGEIRAELQELVRELQLECKISFLGHQSNVLEIMSLFDMLVCCSHSEGLALVIAEAMALKKPVIGTKVGGIPEIIADGQSGILVAKGDVMAISRAMEDLLEDPSMREKMGLVGRNICKDKFLVDKAVQNLQDVYTQILKR